MAPGGAVSVMQGRAQRPGEGTQVQHPRSGRYWLSAPHGLSRTDPCPFPMSPDEHESRGGHLHRGAPGTREPAEPAEEADRQDPHQGDQREVPPGEPARPGTALWDPQRSSAPQRTPLTMPPPPSLQGRQDLDFPSNLMGPETLKGKCSAPTAPAKVRRGRSP